MSYPPHISDPIRRQIAEEFLQHEFKKLFTSISDPETWKKIEAEIHTWFDGHPNLAPVRDFWNGFHGISRGFKLKTLLAPLTSEHMQWEYTHLTIDDIYFGFKFPIFEPLPDRWNTGRTIRDFFTAMPSAEYATLKKDQFAQYTHTNEVNHFPIIVLEYDKKLVVTDGNRRTLQAIFRDETTIYAAVGHKVADPLIYNAWVPTSTLFDLFDIHRFNNTPGLTETMAAAIMAAISTSESGRYELIERVLPGTNLIESQPLKELVTKLLKN